MASIYQLSTLFVLGLAVYFANGSGQADELTRNSNDDDSIPPYTGDAAIEAITETTISPTEGYPTEPSPPPVRIYPSKSSNTGGQKPSKYPVTIETTPPPTMGYPTKPPPGPIYPSKPFYSGGQKPSKYPVTIETTPTPIVEGPSEPGNEILPTWEPLVTGGPITFGTAAPTIDGPSKPLPSPVPTYPVPSTDILPPAKPSYIGGQKPLKYPVTIGTTPTPTEEGPSEPGNEILPTWEPLVTGGPVTIGTTEPTVNDPSEPIPSPDPYYPVPTTDILPPSKPSYIGGQKPSKYPVTIGTTPTPTAEGPSEPGNEILPTWEPLVTEGPATFGTTAPTIDGTSKPLPSQVPNYPVPSTDILPPAKPSYIGGQKPSKYPVTIGTTPTPTEAGPLEPGNEITGGPVTIGTTAPTVDDPSEPLPAPDPTYPVPSTDVLPPSKPSYIGGQKPSKYPVTIETTQTPPTVEGPSEPGNEITGGPVTVDDPSKPLPSPFPIYPSKPPYSGGEKPSKYPVTIETTPTPTVEGPSEPGNEITGGPVTIGTTEPTVDDPSEPIPSPDPYYPVPTTDILPPSKPSYVGGPKPSKYPVTIETTPTPTVEGPSEPGNEITGGPVTIATTAPTIYDPSEPIPSPDPSYPVPTTDILPPSKPSYIGGQKPSKYPVTIETTPTPTVEGPSEPGNEITGGPVTIGTTAPTVDDPSEPLPAPDPTYPVPSTDVLPPSKPSYIGGQKPSKYPVTIETTQTPPTVEGPSEPGNEITGGPVTVDDPSKPLPSPFPIYPSKPPYSGGEKPSKYPVTVETTPTPTVEGPSEPGNEITGGPVTIGTTEPTVDDPSEPIPSPDPYYPVPTTDILPPSKPSYVGGPKPSKYPVTIETTPTPTVEGPSEPGNEITGGPVTIGTTAPTVDGPSKPLPSPFPIYPSKPPYSGGQKPSKYPATIETTSTPTVEGPSEAGNEILPTWEPLFTGGPVTFGTTAPAVDGPLKPLPSPVPTYPVPSTEDLPPYKPPYTGGQKPSKYPVSIGKPSAPIVEVPTKPLPSPGPIDPIPSICGKKRYCYQWFHNELELFLEGYELCNAIDELRARRYCCIR